MTDKIELKVIKMESEITHIKETTTRLETKMDNFIKCADKKYAAKLVEKIVYGLVSLILIAVVSSLIYLVIK